MRVKSCDHEIPLPVLLCLIDHGVYQVQLTSLAVGGT